MVYRNNNRQERRDNKIANSATLNGVSNQTVSFLLIPCDDRHAGQL